MNRSTFVSSFAALSFVLAACSSDDAVIGSAPAPAASSIETTPAPSTSASTPTTPPAPPPPPVPVVVEQDAGVVDPPVVEADAGPPPAWEPTKIPQLGLWLRADKGLPAVITKAGIASWKDASGNKNDATSFGQNVHPSKYGTLDAIAFDGTKAMTITDSATMRWASDFTLIIVARSTQTSAQGGGQLFGKTELSSPYTGPTFFVNYPGGQNKNMGGLGAGFDSNSFTTSNELGLDDGYIHVFTMERKGASLFVRVDDMAPAEKASLPLSDTSAIGSDAVIGGHIVAGNVTQGFHGDLFEIIAVPTALDDTAFAAVYAYAAQRYIK